MADIQRHHMLACTAFPACKAKTRGRRAPAGNCCVRDRYGYSVTAIWTDIGMRGTAMVRGGGGMKMDIVGGGGGGSSKTGRGKRVKTGTHQV